MGSLRVFRIVFRAAVLSILSAALSAPQDAGCDVNHDGKVDVVDVQLITNMEIGAPGFSCTVNIGGLLRCTDAARQVVVKAALGEGCHFTLLTWKPSAEAGIIGYYVYRSAAPNGKSLTLLNPGRPLTGTSYVDIAAVTGITYFYVVRATDGSRERLPLIKPSVTEK